MLFLPEKCISKLSIALAPTSPCSHPSHPPQANHDHVCAQPYPPLAQHPSHELNLSCIFQTRHHYRNLAPPCTTSLSCAQPRSPKSLISRPSPKSLISRPSARPHPHVLNSIPMCSTSPLTRTQESPTTRTPPPLRRTPRPHHEAHPESFKSVKRMFPLLRHTPPTSAPPLTARLTSATEHAKRWAPIAPCLARPSTRLISWSAIAHNAPTPPSGVRERRVSFE